MDAPRRGSPLADPDFNPESVARVRLVDLDPLEHQRMVVNPFLAVFALAVGLKLFFWMIEIGAPVGSGLIAVCTLLLFPPLIHFHCLDCGRTGSYSQRKHHLCPGIINRGQRDEPSARWIPTARAQRVFWVYVLCSVGLLLAVRAIGASN